MLSDDFWDAATRRDNRKFPENYYTQRLEKEEGLCMARLDNSGASKGWCSVMLVGSHQTEYYL